MHAGVQVTQQKAREAEPDEGKATGPGNAHEQIGHHQVVDGMTARRSVSTLMAPTCSRQVCAESRSGARTHGLALSRCHAFGILACMQRWVGTLCVLALAGGAGVLGIACGTSVGISHKDAGQPTDVPSSSGGASGSGGTIGTGGITMAGGSAGAGAGGTSSTAVGGTGGSGTGGATMSGTGGRNPGGAQTGGAGTSAGGSGGTRTGGTQGSGGSGTGGMSGSGGSGSGGTLGSGGTTTRDAGTAATGGTGGLDAGQAATYSGCTYIGGIDRAGVAKFDPQTGLCVALVLASPSGAPDAGFGLSLTPSWGVQSATLWPSTAGDCANWVRVNGVASATSASGSVTIHNSPYTLDIDAVLSFPASDAGPAQSIEMKAQGVDLNHGC